MAYELASICNNVGQTDQGEIRSRRIPKPSGTSHYKFYNNEVQALPRVALYNIVLVRHRGVYFLPRLTGEFCRYTVRAQMYIQIYIYILHTKRARYRQISSQI